ncbi:glycosyltransferase [Polaromonas sp. YR568]|uniref:glycosyltransferase n=1 Tax=Polaromonas sp. YR568 TaxID=1855301 RepID=UPI00398BBEB9
MEFTGERFIPTVNGKIRLEHYHRYAIAQQLARGKDVLDVACGEGYGSAFLAETALSVCGVDVSEEAVAHARTSYQSGNLKFHHSSATQLPFEAASFDLVVSFETIEHLLEQDGMLNEIERVLRPDGMLIISSPNRPVFREESNEDNHFHVKELDFREFDELLNSRFGHIQYLGQKMLMVSAIQPLLEKQDSFYAWHEDGSEIHPDSGHLENPVYFLALCTRQKSSSAPLPASVLLSTKVDVVREYIDIGKWAQSLNDAVLIRDAQIEKIRTSLSWRLTKPLRFAEKKIQAGLSAISAISRVMHKYILGAAVLFGALRKVLPFYDGSVRQAVRRSIIVLRRDGIKGIVQRVRMLDAFHGSFDRTDLPSTRLYGGFPNPGPAYSPKVSVIVPNFNHSKYLRGRLDSIFNQSYTNFEVILMDDCSTDDSLVVLRSYANLYPDKTVSLFNKINSGGVFNQWAKGLEAATGEVIWIAESDDYCSLNFLEELIPSFANPAVKLAFTRVDFVQNDPPTTVWTSEEYLSDLGLDIWKRPFITSAHAIVNSAWVVKNIVPNASGALFRHPGSLALLADPNWLKMRVCGDWMFYLSVIRGGLVAYSPKATNHYRQHPLNTSTNFQAEDGYYREHEAVGKHLAQLFKLEPADFKRQENQLYQHWRNKRGDFRPRDFASLYASESILACAKTRKPNIVMAAYALIAGGGETFPISLANLLTAAGYGVTFFNGNFEKTEVGIRNMISTSIPLLEADRVDLAGAFFFDMGIELVHSHHASIDLMLATQLSKFPDIRHVISMHGMYELMPPAQFAKVLPKLEARIDGFVYTAEKNASSFPPQFRERKHFQRIDNALPSGPVKPVSRDSLCVGENDFLLCLVSRAIREKGWEEAIQSVVLANERSARPVHLLLVGDGPELERLRPYAKHDFIHFLGFRSNTRDYFASADMGFLPSRFRGESYPLVVIDCLHSGRPVLASNIGEVSEMLWTKEGLAGELFELDDWNISIEKLGETIVRLANAPDQYWNSLKQRVPVGARKFDAGRMVEKYEAVYAACLAIKASPGK